MLQRRLFTAGVLAAPFVRPAFAQAWAPAAPIRMIVAYPAGGPTDVIARIVAADMTGPLGQQVIVENLSGAAGAIGTRTVAKAKPDGLTITFGNNQTHGNNMFMLKDPGYDAVKDFAPLAGAGAFEHVFVVCNELPAKTIQDVIKLAKEKPGALNYGSTGIGSGSHLSTELFMARTGIKMTHVPYRGSAPATNALVAGEVQAQFDQTALPHVKSGAVIGLAMLAEVRHPDFPDIPTLREQGYGKDGGDSWFGILAPAGTPLSIVARLDKAIAEALHAPEVIAKLHGGGARVTYLNPTDFRIRIIAETQMFGDIIRKGDIKLP